MRIIIVLIALAAQSLHLFAEDGSARCYASLETNPVVCKYFLLSTKHVQQRLKLTRPQLQALEAATLSPPASIPSIILLRRSQSELLREAVTDEERLKIRSAGNEKASMLIGQHWAAKLRDILSSVQIGNLDGILLQMRGPCMILEDTNISGRLDLSEEQTKELSKAASRYWELLSSLRQRLLGLQIQPIRKRTETDVDSEVKCLLRVIKEIEKDRDSAIWGALDTEKRRSWTVMCGEPLNIHWEPQYFGTVPFGKVKH